MPAVARVVFVLMYLAVNVCPVAKLAAPRPCWAAASAPARSKPVVFAPVPLGIKSMVTFAAPAVTVFAAFDPNPGTTIGVPVAAHVVLNWVTTTPGVVPVLHAAPVDVCALMENSVPLLFEVGCPTVRPKSVMVVPVGSVTEVTAVLGAALAKNLRVQVAAAVTVPVAPKVSAKALPAAKVKTVDAISVLARFLIWFFMVISFKVKKGIF